MNPALPVIVLLAGALMWGVTWIPLRFIAGLGVEGAALSAVAFGVAAAALLPAALAQRGRWSDGPWLLPALVLFGGFANYAFTLALLQGEVIRVMMLFYLAPVWGVLGGWLILGEPLGGRRVTGMLLALCGAALVLGGPALLATSASMVDLLALGAGLAFAMNNVACRAGLTLPMASKLAAMFVGCAAMGGLHLYATAAPLPGLGAGGWGWLIAYGLLWLVPATLATQWAVTHMEAGRASIILIAELLAAVLSAALLAGERMDTQELLGGSLILLATILEARRPGPTPGCAHC